MPGTGPLPHVPPASPHSTWGVLGGRAGPEEGRGAGDCVLLDTTLTLEHLHATPDAYQGPLGEKAQGAWRVGSRAWGGEGRCWVSRRQQGAPPATAETAGLGPRGPAAQQRPPPTPAMSDYENEDACWSALEGFRVKLISAIDPARVTPYLRQCNVLSPDDEEQVLSDPNLVTRKRKVGQCHGRPHSAPHPGPPTLTLPPPRLPATMPAPHTADAPGSAPRWGQAGPLCSLVGHHMRPL